MSLFFGDSLDLLVTLGFSSAVDGCNQCVVEFLTRSFTV